MKSLLLLCFLILFSGISSSFAQNYIAKVSRDSAATLSSRIEVLNSAIKLNQLKLSEADQESDIEKQKLRIIDLRGSEKEAVKESSRLAEALKEGKETDMKKIEKISRKATAAAKDLKTALDKLQKQIDRVEETRTRIQTEERKLANREHSIIFKD
jgi:chromosome segregation ATPase